MPVELNKPCQKFRWWLNAKSRLRARSTIFSGLPPKAIPEIYTFASIQTAKDLAFKGTTKIF